MASTWKHEDAFPIIARLIDTTHQGTRAFVTHDELVAAILEDGAGKSLIENARHADGDEKSEEWWAGNMIAWFGQRITEEKSECVAQFERTDAKPYAYRPKRS